MKLLKRIAQGVGLLVAGLAVALVIWALLPPSTPAIDGPSSIATIERVHLGGVEQAILVRGRDTAAPVLLYVHGGPGTGHLPIARTYSELLEDEFVVVHWDQSGAGASCEGAEWDTISLDGIVTETIELSEILAARFGDDGKIFLLGHSWGSLVGALAAQRRPDLYHAYIGVGQLVDGRQNEELSYAWVEKEAKRREDTEALAALAQIAPPYADNDQLRTQREILHRYRGSIYAVDQAKTVLPSLFFGREYTLANRLSYLSCMERSLATLWPEVEKTNLRTQIPRLEVPVFFFNGRHDWNTPTPLVEDWAAQLSAPEIELVWFENAGHFVPIEAPYEFQRALIDRVLPIAAPAP
ncbi:MAG: alpha/beta hydrolase [Candidatus Binatia bacterium]|nr:alpha/beta hydrolase [Candidatus Binatia bacterium]